MKYADMTEEDLNEMLETAFQEKEVAQQAIENIRAEQQRRRDEEIAELKKKLGKA